MQFQYGQSCLKFFNISWVLPRQYINLFRVDFCDVGNKRGKKLWNSAVLDICWSFWVGINKRIFTKFVVWHCGYSMSKSSRMYCFKIFLGIGILHCLVICFKGHLVPFLYFHPIINISFVFYKKVYFTMHVNILALVLCRFPLTKGTRKSGITRSWKNGLFH